jgi:hypothetical protein
MPDWSSCLSLSVQMPLLLHSSRLISPVIPRKPPSLEVISLRHPWYWGVSINILLVTFVGYCLGNIVGPFCFNSTPGPVFTGGFTSCVVSVAAVMLVAIYGRWHLARENARRDREYGPATDVHALDDLTDRENKSFRYAL